MASKSKGKPCYFARDCSYSQVWYVCSRCIDFGYGAIHYRNFVVKDLASTTVENSSEKAIYQRCVLKVS
jgi:hypothetical protein